MQELTFVGLSDDGSRLLLALSDGRRFALPIDERLRAATRGGGGRKGQMALPTDSLRPRDVQARLRAGATAEEVVEQSGWSLERVEAFAFPIMQERNFIADQAQRSLVRHHNGELPLVEVVTQRLAIRGVDVSDLKWDAWRGEDGRWTVLLAYPAGRNDQVATWIFDTESRTLQPIDDEARWLSEHHEEPAVEPEPVAADPDEPGAQIVNLPPAKGRIPDAEMSRHPALRRQAEAAAKKQSGQRTSAANSARQPTSVDAQQPEPEEAVDPPEQSRPPKRATVPSWDEILFGGPGETDRS